MYTCTLWLLLLYRCAHKSRCGPQGIVWGKPSSLQAATISQVAWLGLLASWLAVSGQYNYYHHYLSYAVLLSPLLFSSLPLGDAEV